MTFYRRPYWRNNNPQMQNTNAVPPGVNVRVSDPTLKDRLEKVLSEPSLNNDAKIFMKSLLDYFNARGFLSQKQVDCLVRNELKLNPQLQAASQNDYQAWLKEYDQNKRENATKIAQWYKKQHEISPAIPYYYQHIAEKVLSDPNYVPSRESYNKMVMNKHAVRYFKNTIVDPKYEGGNIVQLTAVAVKKYGHLFPHDIGFVMAVTEPTRNVSGGFIVHVLPMGSDVMVEIEERWLKPAKEDK